MPLIGYLAELLVTIARLPLLVRSQRQTESHLIAQQERLAGHITQTNHQLLEKLKGDHHDVRRQANSLREAVLALRKSLTQFAQQQKEIAVQQHQQVSALFREQQNLRNNHPTYQGLAGSHLVESP